MSSNYHFLGKTLDLWCLEYIRDDSGQLKHYNQWNKSGYFVKVNWKPYMGSNKNLSKNYTVVKKNSAVLCKSRGFPKFFFENWQIAFILLIITKYYFSQTLGGGGAGGGGKLLLPPTTPSPLCTCMHWTRLMLWTKKVRFFFLFSLEDLNIS